MINFDNFSIFPDVNLSLIVTETYFLDIKNETPLFLSVILYGYFSPFLVAVTALANGFIIAVLSHKHLRTPTNIVLLFTAVNELVTELSAVIWYFYFYTLGNYKNYSIYLEDDVSGIPPFWCIAKSWLHCHIPNMFHTAAVWLFVYICIYRYYQICKPNLASNHDLGSIGWKIIIINLLAALSITPHILSMDFYNITSYDYKRYFCLFSHGLWLRPYFYMRTTFQIFNIFYAFAHFVPCVLLFVFTYKLAEKMTEAHRKKLSLIACTGGIENSLDDRRKRESRKLRTTNRILACISGWVIFLELQAVLIYLMTLVRKFNLTNYNESLQSIERHIRIIRCITIIMSSSIQFGVYCYMSEQFRVTVRQMFTKETLYTVHCHNTATGLKKWTLVLTESSQMNTKISLFNFFRRLVPKYFTRNLNNINTTSLTPLNDQRSESLSKNQQIISNPMNSIELFDEIKIELPTIGSSLNTFSL